MVSSAPPSKSGVPVPDAVRFFFVTTDGVHRQFLRFMGVGEDVYWGPPGRGPLYESTSSLNDDGSVSVTVGAELKVSSSTKVSYHASGQVHVKDGDVMQGGPMWQVPPASLAEPVLVGILLTKVPTLVPEYRKKVPDHACVNFILDPESEQRRQSVELWLTPSGAHTFPGNRRPLDFATTVTPSLIVCGWLSLCDEAASSWHPDKSILIAGAS